MEVSDIMHRYANFVLQLGVNLQSAQGLHIWAPAEVSPFVYILCKVAYRLGASNVIISYFDSSVLQARMQYGQQKFLRPYPEEEGQLQVSLAEKGYAFLKLNRFEAITYQDINPKQIYLAQEYLDIFGGMKLFTHAAKLQSVSAVVPTISWATQVHPNEDAKQAINTLWNDLKIVCKLERNYMEYWITRMDELERRRCFWNDQQFDCLYFKGSSCDLMVELIDQHLWVGGLQESNGVAYLPNIPTEELFCANKKYGINGHFSITKPFLFQGCAIHDLHFEVQNGKIINLTSNQDIEGLRSFLLEKESRQYFGEIAFVSKESSLYQHSVIFGCTLLDENAACHIALGNSYQVNAQHFKGSKAEHQMNESDIHMDLMLGCDDIEVYGYHGEVKTLLYCGTASSKE